MKKSLKLERIKSRRFLADANTAELFIGFKPLDSQVFVVFGEDNDSMIKAGFSKTVIGNTVIFHHSDDINNSILAKNYFTGAKLVKKVIEISERNMPKCYNYEYYKVSLGNKISDTHIALLKARKILNSFRELRRIEDNSILVGGAVRDISMNLDPKDLDYEVMNETFESMLKAGFISVGKDFPVFLHPDTGDEYALARTERKTGKGYKGFSFSTKNMTYKKAASRRDLTINSMGMLKDGTILDPYNGLKDIENKILRHTSNSFSEDPLRVLRIARFVARYPEFTIAPETVELAKKLKCELAELTAERVNKELEKALTSKKPSEYFRNLLLLDALDVLYPEIFSMIGVEQRVDYHAEGDVFEHTMRVLDEVSLLTEDPVFRFAALYHDIGKPLTTDENGSFKGHEKEDLINELFLRINTKGLNKIYETVAKQVAINHTFVHIFPEVSSKNIVKRMMGKYFPKNNYELNALLTVSLADNYGRVLGNRKLSFDEVERIFNGEELDGFIKGKSPEYYHIIEAAFNAFNKKVIIPEEILSLHYTRIKEYIYREKIRNVAEVIKNEKL